MQNSESINKAAGREPTSKQEAFHTDTPGKSTTSSKPYPVITAQTVTPSGAQTYTHLRGNKDGGQSPDFRAALAESTIPQQNMKTIQHYGIRELVPGHYDRNPVPLYQEARKLRRMSRDVASRAIPRGIASRRARRALDGNAPLPVDGAEVCNTCSGSSM